MANLLLVIIYIAFISLGLPDPLLGATWPSMYPELGVDISAAGIISMIIAGGTIVSAFLSDRLTRRLGAGLLTAISVALTALAMLAFSVSHQFWLLCLFAVPYGIGAGGVDAALNNYVALHYGAHHMSWLHCMWGVGTTVGPIVMGKVLTSGLHWNKAYLFVGIFQVVLTAGILCSLKLWKKPEAASDAETGPVLPFRQILKIPGAKEAMTAFFCYCAVEQTAMLWGGSYLTLNRGFAPETAASLAAMFYIGITAGRAVNGFLTFRFSDSQLIYAGSAVIAAGILLMAIPGKGSALAGLILIGLGCAPVYPCTIHSTPDHFGPENSQALIGVQMAVSYLGILAMPPLFGLIAGKVSIALLPVYLMIILVCMVLVFRRLDRITAEKKAISNKN